ncbi:MAG: tetratricopeptide repeat protein [Candidatus Riflebacteria bacterium]|nr:tetratricopeptide repeat protein [Candidatus Riflebacteria bacterium]
MKKRLLTIALLILFVWAIRFIPSVSASPSPTPWNDYGSAISAGDRAFEQGKYNAAVLAFQSALALRADQVKPRFRLGQSLFATGAYSEACGHFQQILANYPNNIKARLLFAQCLIKMGKAAEAVEHIKWILSVQPEHAEARTLFSQISSGSQNSDPSSVQSKEAVVVAPNPMLLGTEQPTAIASQSAFENNSLPTPQGVLTARNSEKKNVLPIPPLAENTQSWKVQDFLSQNEDSFAVNLEFSKYCLERDELKKARKFLEAAEKLALSSKDTRRFLETMIFKSLLLLYEADLRAFGEELFKIRPLLSKETYSSFLDIYNKTQTASSPVDVAKIVGGVAMGTEHFTVATRILKEVVNALPNDILALSMLARAQMEILDFQSAEQNFKRLMEIDNQNPEHLLNLARFYLTAKFDPPSAKIFAQKAFSMDSADFRPQVFLALADYCVGKTKNGIERLKRIPAKNLDPETAYLVRRVLSEGAALRDNEISRDRVAKMLSMPGIGGKNGMISLGEEHLKRNSEFQALRCFMEAKDLSEVGRGWLALSTHFFRLGDEKASARAAGCGLQALQDELRRPSRSGKAYLYMALYFFERKNIQSTKEQCEAGLRVNPPPEVKRHLLMLKSQLG